MKICLAVSTEIGCSQAPGGLIPRRLSLGPWWW